MICTHGREFKDCVCRLAVFILPVELFGYGPDPAAAWWWSEIAEYYTVVSIISWPGANCSGQITDRGLLVVSRRGIIGGGSVRGSPERTSSKHQGGSQERRRAHSKVLKPELPPLLPTHCAA